MALHLGIKIRAILKGSPCFKSNLTEKKFAVVSFPDEDEQLFIVASHWLLPDKFSQYSCLWPPYISEEKVKVSVLKNEKPEPTWRKCNTNLVLKCKTYEDAESTRDSIMKISDRRSSLILDQLQGSISPPTKSPSKEILLKNSAFPGSSLLIFNDIMRKLSNKNIEKVSFSFKEASETVSDESCQTEQIVTLSTVCGSCKSKASILKTPTETSITNKEDVTYLGTKHHCMKNHEDKSLKELREESLSEKTTNITTSEAASISDCNEIDEFVEFRKVDPAGAASSATFSWSAIKFKPPTETNVVMTGSTSTYVGTRLQCITCMKEYEDKSFEELRIGDLCLGVSPFSQSSCSQQKTTQKPMNDTINTNVFAARWTARKFKPVTETNVTMIAEIPFFIGTRLQCITCMKEYEDKSFEELRIEELSLETIKTPVLPSNPFKAIFPFSSTFAFSFKMPFTKHSIYPLMFGASGTTGGFEETKASSSSAVKFRPVIGPDKIIKGGKSIPINTQLQSITCMKEYEDKSFEEIRVENVIASRKERSPFQMIFGTPVQPTHLTGSHTIAASFSGANSKSLFAPSGVRASSYPAIKFKAVTGSDEIFKAGSCFPVNIRLQSITCMKEYEDKSFEELRAEHFVRRLCETPIKSAPSTFTFTGEKSKSVFDSKDMKSSFNGFTNKSTFGVSSQPAWNHSPFYGSSFPSSANTLFKI